MKVKFEEYETEVDYLTDGMDIDFNGCLMILVEETASGFIAINGMNGYGENVQDEVYGKPIVII